MKQPIQLTNTIPSVTASNSLSPSRRGFGLSALVLAWLALSLAARAVTPAPDGGYPNNNTAEGDNALFSLTSGFGNTAIGFNALNSNTSSGDNTATGASALASNTTGYDNTANGFAALASNTTGIFNTAIGSEALINNTSGSENTATGDFALLNNTTGINNTAEGFQALFHNTSGGGNLADGLNALYSNTTGSNNTANGLNALFSNTTGISNTAEGFQALISNTTGNNNTATGVNALLGNTGSNNTANGNGALANNTTGSDNIALGASAGSNLTEGTNNIEIGNMGVAGESARIRIGTRGTHKNTFIAGISGITVPGGIGVIIDAHGHLGTVTSSERFKEAIKPMDEASEAILALKPVTFHYKHELDPEGIPQFGLVAEQVEKVSPDLIARDDQGKVYTVRYEAVNAMLLNEFLKQHRKVEEQEANITELKSAVAREEAVAVQQQKQIIALTATVQKVSDQLEVSKAPPQMVVSNQ